jgi:hypothetical protein
MQASFHFMDFFTIEVEASRIKRRHEELMSSAGGNGRIILVTKNSFDMVAWLPLISPEESLEGIKATIGSMRNCMAQEDTYELDWVENYESEEPVWMVQVKASPEMVTYMQKLLEENSPFQYAGKEIRPILRGESTGNQFYQDVMHQHLMSMSGKCVLRVNNIPLWFKPEMAIITEAMYGGPVAAEHSEWRIVDLLRNLRSSGMVVGEENAVILQVLPGNTETSLSLVHSADASEAAWGLNERILQIISAAVGNAAAAKLSIEAFPPREENHQDQFLNSCKPSGFEPTNDEMDEDEDSINQEEHILPHQLKSPPEALLPMETRIERLEKAAVNLESTMAMWSGMNNKLDKFSVSLTEMSTEISDLRSTSSSLKGLLESSSSSSDGRLIGPRLRRELKEIFTEAAEEVNSRSLVDPGGEKIKEVERIMVDNCIPKLVSELNRADQEADKSWIKDHGEAFADKLAVQVASAVAIEVEASVPNVGELNESIREFKSLVDLIREEADQQGQALA